MQWFVKNALNLFIVASIVVVGFIYQRQYARTLELEKKTEMLKASVSDLESELRKFGDGAMELAEGLLLIRSKIDQVVDNKLQEKLAELNLICPDAGDVVDPAPAPFFGDFPEPVLPAVPESFME